MSEMQQLLFLFEPFIRTFSPLTRSAFTSKCQVHKKRNFFRSHGNFDPPTAWGERRSIQGAARKTRQLLKKLDQNFPLATACYSFYPAFRHRFTAAGIPNDSVLFFTPINHQCRVFFSYSRVAKTVGQQGYSWETAFKP